VVMSEGEVIAEGKHASIVTNPNVINAYLGAHHGTPLDREEQDRQLAAAEAALLAEVGEVVVDADASATDDAAPAAAPAGAESADQPAAEPADAEEEARS
jgi:Branched-chain amino acid ATP-binding cassette transporter